MTFTPIERGTTNWDVPVNAAFADQDARISANAVEIEALKRPYVARGMIGWAYPVTYTSGGTTPGTNGQLYMIRIDIPEPGIASGLYFGFSTAMSGAVAGQNFAGLYNSTGTLIAQTADQSVNFTNTDLITCSFTSPVSLSPGTYFAAFLLNATTRPGILRGVSLTAIPNALNVGQTNSNAGWATTGAGLTALPASVNMATRDKSGNSWWAAIF